MAARVTAHPRFWQSPHGRPLPAPGARTLLMGVLNVTPDSFSDGGKWLDPAAAVAHGSTWAANPPGREPPR